MGGKDVIHIKQLQSSNLQPAEVQKLLKQLADERFSEDVTGNLISNPNELSGKLKVPRILKTFTAIIKWVPLCVCVLTFWL